jgi:Rod binding domain-containing protein
MDPLDALKPSTSSAPLTGAQQAALKKLHDAATQLEGVFVGMLFKEMHADTPDSDIFGKTSNADKTWNDMLDEKRADAVAQTGAFGIAKMVESQLRASVLGSAGQAPVAPPTLPPSLSLPPAIQPEPLPGGDE